MFPYRQAKQPAGGVRQILLTERQSKLPSESSVRDCLRNLVCNAHPDLKPDSSCFCVDFAAEVFTDVGESAQGNSCPRS
jgi:hypothetical protein